MAKITQDQLTADLLDKADRFNSSPTDNFTEESIIGDIISADDGPEGAKAHEIFKAVVKWDINNNGAEVKEWPENWLTLTFKQLAGSLLIFLLLFLASFKSQAQLSVNISTAKTAFKNGAIKIGIEYLRNLDSKIGGKENIKYGKHSVFVYTPAFDFQFGTSDVMSSITAKITALYVIFKTKDLQGLTVADLNKTFTTIPISAGVETNGSFGFINGLAEVGYAPWFAGKFAKHLTMAAYLQGGYKFNIDTAVGFGGNTDQSAEAIDDALFRAKGYLAVDSKTIVKVGDLKAGLIGKATGWWDIANSTTYYRLDGILRIYLSESNSFDISIQKGSGAPNFNQGTQYSGGLTIRF